MKVGKLDLNIFDSNISNLQQGWRFVVAVYRQAQTELRLWSREATDSASIPKQFSTPSQLAQANAVAVLNNLPSGQCCSCRGREVPSDDHLKHCSMLNRQRVTDNREDIHHHSWLSLFLFSVILCLIVDIWYTAPTALKALQMETFNRPYTLHSLWHYVYSNMWSWRKQK